MKIFVLSPNKDGIFTPELVTKLESMGEVVFETVPKAFEQIPSLLEPGEKIVALDPDFFDWKLPNEFFDKVPDIKAACLQTTSFSWLDVAYAKEKGIPVVNLKGFSTEAVAEFAFMLALGVSRKLGVIVKDEYKQDFVKHQGIELVGKTAAIIGFGRIGSRIAELCEGFGMKVMYWSAHSKNAKYQFAELEELFRTADVLFPTLAQNEETTGVITDELLKSMKEQAMFISIVHKIYNHDLLLTLVKERKIYGYGFEEDNGSPHGFEGNVLALPAVAWATDESMKMNGRMWVSAIEEAVKSNYPTRIN